MFVWLYDSFLAKWKASFPIGLFYIGVQNKIVLPDKIMLVVAANIILLS